MTLRDAPDGAVPEQVLVLETVGPVENFVAAVRRVPGMEWLAEWDAEEIPPDEDFRDPEHPERPLAGRLFLILTNQDALQELLRLWDLYRQHPEAPFRYGMNKWRRLFRQLHAIRPWGPDDRLYQTGAREDWAERLAQGEAVVRVEAELWFRSEDARHRAETSFRGLVSAEDGRVVGQAILPEAGYHGLLAELPASSVRRLLRDVGSARLLLCDDVMFFRPVGQAAVRSRRGAPSREPAPDREPLPAGEPVVAVFDGLPLENHKFLRRRLIVDDPDGWGSSYPANARVHGTAMASLIIRGDLGASAPALARPVYLRPIMRPDPRAWREPSESVPPDVLFPDLLQRAVSRLFETLNGGAPVAPTTRLINLSIGDQSRPFYNALSSWARVLDWLSWRYNVLFVVSAGNHPGEVTLSVARADFPALSRDELPKEVLKAISANAINRRLLAPAEAVNALTVAGLHADASAGPVPLQLIDPYPSVALPSTFNAVGLGFRRAVKPDLLAEAGRLLYREKLGNRHPQAVLLPSDAETGIGQKVAAPGQVPGEASATRHESGTSNAAALVTRAGAQFFDLLVELRGQVGTGALNEEFDSVLLKAALAHGALWGDAGAKFQSALGGSGTFRDYATRFMGYGTLSAERVMTCTDQRATVLGCGKLPADEGHVYSLPLPPSLSGKRLWRRLTITLAWFTPINPAHRSYRRAALWFEAPQSAFTFNRTDVEARACRRGTLQHEIFEGEAAAAYGSNDSLTIQVNCRAEAGDLAEQVRYALIATLEIAPGQPINIYDEISVRIRERVAIRGTEGASARRS